jgi:formylglycine-generating enzyme required for sulfatase activity
MAGEALDVFISYSRRDEGLKDELVNYHLKLLKREGKINTWQDRDIEAGAEWATEIKTNLEKADIVLLLITRHFLASDYCYETEMQRAVQRHYDGTARVIPIILETCGWQYGNFSQLQALPKDGKPVTRWEDKAEAFFDVEEGIRRVVDHLNAERQQAAALAQAEADRQRQQTAERQRQQEKEAERQERERKAAELRQRAAAERLRQDYETELLRQQAEADRQAQERQKQEAAERQRQQQEAAEQLKREQQTQLAEERQRQREAAAARRQPGQTSIGRRRVLQVAGLGGGSLILAMAANSLRTERPGNSPRFPEPSSISGSSPDDVSTVDIQTVKVNNTGNITERNQGQVSAFREDLGNTIGLDMVEIPAGEFVMGSPTEEEGRDDDEGPQRTVTLPKFFMGRFQITQAQYESVIGENPSRFQGANRPVERVSWDAAVAFCEKLSEQTGRTYRLPSEAEWEYACRAGTTTPFYFGSTITTDLANYRGTDREFEGNTYLGNYGQGPKGSFREQTTEVGSFPPNAFGLYDMHGNVWEWCQDVWHENYEGAPTDGSAWLEGGNQTSRLLRGGSWGDIPVFCRSAARVRDAPDGTLNDVGFRVVCGGV